jgi:hypothetical protein
MYRLDRTSFKIQTYDEATHTRAFWLSKSVNERLKASWYLTCAAFNIDIQNPPKLDKSVFSLRKNG